MQFKHFLSWQKYGKIKSLKQQLGQMGNPVASAHSWSWVRFPSMDFACSSCWCEFSLRALRLLCSINIWNRRWFLFAFYTSTLLRNKTRVFQRHVAVISLFFLSVVMRLKTICEQRDDACTENSEVSCPLQTQQQKDTHHRCHIISWIISSKWNTSHKSCPAAVHQTWACVWFLHMQLISYRWDFYFKHWMFFTTLQPSATVSDKLRRNSYKSLITDHSLQK